MTRLMPEGLDAFPASLLQEAIAGYSAKGREHITFGEPIAGVVSDGRKVDRQKVLGTLRKLDATDQVWISLGKTADRGIDREISQEFWDALAGMTLGGIGRHASGGHRVVRDVTISDLRCAELDLDVQDVVFRNLKVARMKINSSHGGTIRFENCAIGRLEFHYVRGSDLSFVDVSILCMTLSSDTGQRSIDISGTRIAKRPLLKGKAVDCPNWIYFDAVTFRQLHRWAQDAEDAKLAHQMRGHQLSVDYYLASPSEKPFLKLWWLFGNYGLDLWRPLAWLLGLLLGFAALLYFTGTVAADAVLPIGKDAAALEQIGWRRVLIGDDCAARLARALVGATEAIFSPVNVFSIRKLVLPAHWSVAVFQFFYSYLCLGLIFLFGFSIRRRFKI